MSFCWERWSPCPLFKDFYNDYTKYEIVVGGIPKAKTTLPGVENQTEAMFNGSVSPEGNAVEYHFEYEGPGVTGKQSTASTPLNVADFASHSVSETVSGLRAGSTYHVELVVTYGAGKSLGGLETFTTPAAAAPMATTGAAGGLHETEATLNGKVDPPLSARARTALHHRHRLGLTVQIVLTPLSSPVARVSGSVTLHK